jgi:hypothetical protein
MPSLYEPRRSILAQPAQKTKSTESEIYLKIIVQYVSSRKTLTLIVGFVIRNEDGIIVERTLLVCQRTSAPGGQGGNLFPCSCADDLGVQLRGRFRRHFF